ncbi:oxidoreductase, short chain dehydrogenase/reductase family [Aspergillus foveolatus]|uniref:oxidoreductase, short chain dehydrogenase/reductase family n=1 Tax=Aspergillus foveolatus TaxID=210207 RepID=UPI003CCD486B
MSSYISTNKLHNSRILLIGGTSGIGFGVARASLEHGASVIVSSSNPERVANAVSELKSLYPEEPYVSRIVGKVCDLGKDDDSIEAEVVGLFEFATKRGLFNDEGEGEGKVPINHIVFTADPSVSASYLRSLHTIRYIGGALVAKHAPTYMPKPSHNTPSSSITYTSGGLLVRPRPGLSLGLVGAAIVEGLARTLAVDLAPFGIRVNAVSLGPVRTAIFDAFGSKDVVEGILETYAEQTVLGRVGAPEDTAETYLGLMKDGNITGALVRTDGGFTLK